MTRVVKSDELDKPDEGLSELMKKLKLSPQGGKKTLAHSHTCIAHLSSEYTLHALHTETGSRPQIGSTTTDSAAASNTHEGATHTVSAHSTFLFATRNFPPLMEVVVKTIFVHTLSILAFGLGRCLECKFLWVLECQLCVNLVLV